MVVTVLLGVAGVTVDDADNVVVDVVAACVTLVGGTIGGVESVSSQTVFLLPRRLRSLPLSNTQIKIMRITLQKYIKYPVHFVICIVM